MAPFYLDQRLRVLKIVAQKQNLNSKFQGLALEIMQRSFERSLWLHIVFDFFKSINSAAVCYVFFDLCHGGI